MLWSRKSAPVHEKSRAVGVDITSSRARAVSVTAGKSRTLALDDQTEELPMFLALDKRTPEVGRAGYSLCRKTPHTVCSNFLPALTQGREWRCNRTVLTPETALEITFNKISGSVAAESEAAVLALPTYLSPAQVTRTVSLALRAKFPLKGTAVGLLALVADRAAAVLTGKPVAPEVTPPEWIVPLRPTEAGPGAVAVIDADEYALSAVVMLVERDRVKLVATESWPRFAIKTWKDKLIDAIADRCVRLCRRDPRDSADAEQSLFEQLDDALDRTRAGQRVNLTVRTDRWFQDVVQQPEEFDGHCLALARGASDAVCELVNSTSLVLPPRTVWLTHDAGKLPGLARAIHMNTHEGAAVEVLPAAAVSQAAAALVPRWLKAELPRAHLDSVIQLPIPGYEPAADKPATKGRR
jgi:hypothetical protein